MLDDQALPFAIIDDGRPEEGVIEMDDYINIRNKEDWFTYK